MEIAIIVVTIVLALAVIASFVVPAVIMRKKGVATPMGFTTEEYNALSKKEKLKIWWDRHKPSKRRLIQVYAALLFNANIKGYITGDIYTGNTKYMCIPSLNCYSCPGAVGACPLGALQNALSSANKRAPYYVLGIFAIFCLILARTVCGFLCPAGLVQEWLYKIRTPKLKKSKVTRVLSYFKYVVLIVLVLAVPVIYGLQDLALPGFCKYICPSGTLGGAVALLINPSNAGTFASLGPLFTWKFCVLIAIGVASVFIYRAFCRFLCPLGAIYGFFNRIALLGVKLDSGKCTDCGLCVSHCKMDIRKVGDHECINCGECIPVCPAKAISWKGSQIFVRGTTVSVQPQEEVKPLNEMLNKPAAAMEAASEVAESAPVIEEEVVVTDSSVKPKTKRGRNFWIQVGAWALALGLLLAALICYNVDFKKPLVPPSPPDMDVGYEIGDLCPDFTLEMYQGGGEYNLYSNRGKITLINFWYITCGGCVREMPYIGEFSKLEEYDVEIIAIHGNDTTEPVDDFLVRRGWNEFNIKYMQDIIVDTTTCQTFTALGGKFFWPITVILDEEGIVRYNSDAEFHSVEDIKTIIDGIKNN